MKPDSPVCPGTGSNASLSRGSRRGHRRAGPLPQHELQSSVRLPQRRLNQRWIVRPREDESRIPGALGGRDQSLPAGRRDHDVSLSRRRARNTQPLPQYSIPTGIIITHAACARAPAGWVSKGVTQHDSQGYCGDSETAPSATSRGAPRCSAPDRRAALDEEWAPRVVQKLGVYRPSVKPRQ